MPNTENKEKTIYSVSELNRTIRGLLESQFPLLWIEGEISNLAQPASGHIYFTLKDSKAQVRCAMFKGRKQLVKFKPANGQQILIRAKVGLYEARGEFQLVAEHMEEAGDGALRREFEELKTRLATEGLFDEALKQPLPELPKCIAVITSGTGAAIRDVLSVLKRRFPSIPVQIYPVAVQGEKAAPEIAKALYRASKSKSCDVILLVRGGGSLEDLWAFNEEQVARAIVLCDVPVISGVGHEVDVTIADFTADFRAATPSAAAELVSPNQQTYLHKFQSFQRQLMRQIQGDLNRLNEQSQWLQNRLKMQHPSSQLMQQSQQLDGLIDNLRDAFQAIVSEKKHDLKYTVQSLINNRPDQFIDYQKIQLEDLSSRLVFSSQLNIENKQQQLANLSRTMQAVSPLNTLSRGYSITRDTNGETVTNARQLRKGDIISSEFGKGKVTSRVE
ncbi:MAG: exodeoxyribonuclease VII large subunit [endosymbiont of Galathealinum brachiosum]|uniref:Exodeoxyribonuclease 7 large subunit n=1 Tax=endosymbiont of Galathealinum brachiosum TaxID=2200906 RepID=A0A370DIL5_9GAMM|nr:MAG: exodeoxyribonuclease VII large subunit [endosymbiont of Galathealinum brachiosum]